MPSSLKELLGLRNAAGWKTLVASAYTIVGNMVALWWMFRAKEYHGTQYAIHIVLPVILAAHAKMMAAYLVHEASHESTFVSKESNKWLGVLSLWMCACPYGDYAHIKKMHIAHHVDRTDLVEFDYRTFVKSHVWIQRIVLALEFMFIPVVETIMNLRQALLPILAPEQVSEINRKTRVRSATIGTPVIVLWYAWLWSQGVLLPQILSGMALLHVLALNDAFHHTYEAMFPENYTPGPGDRTAQYEEENTYSNIWSTSWPVLNILMLNFGYHNAHHRRPMCPWFELPAYHDKVYGEKKGKVAESQTHPYVLAESTPQMLPLSAIVWAWHRHRLRRVVEEDYGVVHPPGTPDRAQDFVGALGVSFLTV